MAGFVKILFRVFLILAIIAVSLAACVIWGPVGPMIVEPLVRRYGETAVPALRIGSVDGSLYSGINLNGVSLTSGDDTLLDADRMRIRLSWEELRNGSLWLSDLELEGMRADTTKLSALASRYGGKSEESPRAIRPIHVALRDITFDTPMYPVEIGEGLLAQDGFITLSADLGGLPLRVSGRLIFDPLQAVSLDVSLGSGKAFLGGKLTEPFDVEGALHSVKLGELMAVLPAVSAIPGDGEIEGRFNVMGAGDNLEGSGSIGLKSGSVAGLPVEASTLWSYRDGDLSLINTKIEVMSADVDLRVSADMRPDPAGDRLFARGAVRGVSMKNLERVLSLDVSLEGDNGMVDFWVSADKAGKTAGKFFARLPELKADGRQVVKGLRSNVLFFPDKTVSVDCIGEVFGARISGAGDAAQDGAKWSHAMAFTASGMDVSLLAAAFPALAPATPSGKLDLTLRVTSGGPEQGSPLALGIEARSSALSLAGVRLGGLFASARYENGLATLDELRARIGRAPLAFEGTLNLDTSALRFDGGVRGLDPGSIPDLTGVTGLCDVSVTARGTLESPVITATVAGSNNTVMDIPLSRLALSGVYANDKITINETALPVPGGTLSFRGAVDLPRGREPVLNLSGALRNLDLNAFSRPWGVDASGRASASLAVSGPVSNAAVSASITSDSLMLLSADVRNLDLDFSGTTKNVRVRRLRARINDGSLEGRGGMSFGRDGRIFIDMKVGGLEIRSLLARYGIDAGVGGFLEGELLLRGTQRRPELMFKITSPLTVKETLVDSLSVNIISPARGNFDMEASGRMGDLNLSLKAHMERGGDGWSYDAESGLIDLDDLISAKTPSMRGQISGKAKVRVAGRLKGRRRGETTPLNVTVYVPSISFAGMRLEDASVPISVGDDKALIRKGSGTAYGGKVDVEGDVDLTKKQWEMTARLSGIDIGRAAKPFMAQGAIVGSADVNVKAKGDYGTLMMMFANGDFRAGEGYLHEFDVLKSIADDGRVSFEEIRGSFFWDGGNLWLNPGSQATAKPGDALYKYLAVNGPMGLNNRTLGLDFNGRFNVQALNTVLGALRGLFQLTTGTLTGGGQLVRQAVGRMVGITDRDFQDVSFQLRGSWDELQLLNLKIDKPLEGYLPIRTSDSLPTHREDNRKIKFNIKIPTGPGGEDEENAQDQFKRQLLDNLLNWTIDSDIP